jgi:hypothetical protein
MAATAHRRGTPAKADAFPCVLPPRVSRSAGKFAGMPTVGLRVCSSTRRPGVSGELFDSHGFLGILLLFCGKLGENRRLGGRAAT